MIVLCVVHTVLAVQGRAMDVNQSFFDQFWALLAHDLQVGMVTATIGLALFLLVTVTSIAIVKRGLRYELWYWVHLAAYAGIAFAWFHEIPTGGDVNGAFHPNAEAYWRILFFGSIGLVILCRVVVPVGSAFFYRLRVADVIAEGPTVTSIRISGRRVEKLRPRPGQFFLWRFLTGGFWWTSHPFSLSEAPDGRTLRISVKAAGSDSRSERVRGGTTHLSGRNPPDGLESCLGMRSRVTWGVLALLVISMLVIFSPAAFGAGNHRAQPGNLATGKRVYIAFCGKCHALKAAGAQGTLGPNLDQDAVTYTRVDTAIEERASAGSRRSTCSAASPSRRSTTSPSTS